MSTTHVGLSITKAAVHALDEVLPNGKDREYLEGLNACFQSFTDLRASLPSNNVFLSLFDFKHDAHFKQDCIVSYPRQQLQTRIP
jgi:hypothetical protein